jgi:hypothetical protein
MRNYFSNVWPVMNFPAWDRGEQFYGGSNRRGRRNFQARRLMREHKRPKWVDDTGVGFPCVIA